MNLIEKSQREVWPIPDEYHILTYAEEGFSPLSIHSEKYHLAENVLKDFAYGSNESDQIKTMFPVYNLSVIPRRFVRQKINSFDFHLKLLEFLELNAAEINAKKFIFDFRTHELPEYISKAIYKLKANKGIGWIEEIITIK